MALFGKKKENKDWTEQQRDAFLAAFNSAMKQTAKKQEKQFNDGKIDIVPYETFKIHDLADMFPFNITPALIESKIQHALAAKIRAQEMTRNFIMFALMIMFGGVIAAYVGYKLLGGEGAGAQEIKVTVDYAGNLIGASSNLTG